MAEKKIAVRSQDPGQRRVLDGATRQRRLTRQLEALEKDNFQDDPDASLPPPMKRLPHFDENDEPEKRRKKTRGDHFKQRFRKNFQALLEEEDLSMSEGPNYLTACAEQSKLPQRHFCAVCGLPSNYTCVSCGARYCCVRCLATHHETRKAMQLDCSFTGSDVSQHHRNSRRGDVMQHRGAKFAKAAKKKI